MKILITHFGVRDTSRADTEPGAFLHASAPGKYLPQKGTERGFTDGIQIKRAEVPLAQRSVLHIPQFNSGMGTAAVDSSDKHGFTSHLIGPFRVDLKFRLPQTERLTLLFAPQQKLF